MKKFPSTVSAQTLPAKEPKEKPDANNKAQAKEDALSTPPDLLEIGKQQYMLCAACHGQQGEGLSSGPPLAGSEWVSGPVENLILIQLRGLQGPIKVKGQEYNIPGGMAPLAYQSDQQIAGVLSYIRSSFGNEASGVTPEQVAALRDEVGKPQITADELEQPEGDNSLGPSSSPDKYKDLASSSGIPFWVILAIIATVLVGLKFALKKKSTK